MILRGKESIAKYMDTSQTAITRMVKHQIKGQKFPVIKVGRTYYSESSLVDKFIRELIEKST